MTCPATAQVTVLDIRDPGTCPAAAKLVVADLRNADQVAMFVVVA
jgi:hypothetical protein